MTAVRQVDVVIAGGGLAGLSLALHLAKAAPALEIVVVDKRAFPLPDVHKVGEATVEVGGFYLREILGLREHLESEQVFKTGLRFYMTAGDNRDIGERLEIASDSPLPLETYTVERRSFEEHLAAQVRERGVEILTSSHVAEFTPGDEQHEIAIDGPSTKKLRARWLVDATGRHAFLRKRFKLTRSTQHPTSACWFRVDTKIDFEGWTSKADWTSRVSPQWRRNATNHLCGAGYWVWLIPLQADATSVGIVADNGAEPFTGFNRLERALAWLRDREPQLAATLDAHADEIHGFGAIDQFSYLSETVFSPQRWCLTGEAASFTDPLYSTGIDLIAAANMMIVAMISADAEGAPPEHIAQYTGFANMAYKQVFGLLMTIVRGQYGIFGSPVVFSAKALWDFTLYMCMAPLSVYGKVSDPAFMMKAAPMMERVGALTGRVQAMFRGWALREDGAPRPVRPDFTELENAMRVQRRCREPIDDDELARLIEDNLAILEETSLEIFSRVLPRLSLAPDRSPADPYAISLEPEAWEGEGLFSGPPPTIRESVVRDVDRFWVG